jgi:thioredoxin-related protein
MPSLIFRAEHLKQRWPIFFLCLFHATFVFADTSKLTPLEDMRLLGRESRQHQIPILLLVSQYHCSYCERMKQEVLNPLQLDPAYGQRVLIRELSIDPGEMVIDLRGKRQATADFVTRYNVSVTPTLLFLDAEGREAGQRIVGINTVDFLFLYIDEAIDQATTSK